MQLAIKYKILFLITPVIIVVDQLSKYSVATSLTIGERIPLITNYLDLVHFRNTGAAFGMFAGMNEGFRAPFFYLVAFVAVAVLSFYFYSLRPTERLLPLALALIFGGTVGNVIDRLRYGEVVDFISCHLGDRVIDMSLFGYRLAFPLEWPAFNVADSAITVAMGLLVWQAVRIRS